MHLLNLCECKVGDKVQSYYSGIGYVIEKISVLGYLRDENGFLTQWNLDNNRHFIKWNGQFDLWKQ